MSTPYVWQSAVRDYELDSQGIVNNATYLNYFEHCRNEYLRTLGIDAHVYFKQGYTLVVAAIEVQYRASLMAHQAFYVTVKLIELGYRRAVVEQEIRSVVDDQLKAKAVVTAACIDQKTGKSCMPDALKQQLSAAL